MADGASTRTDALARRVRSGEPAALARALTRAENGDEPLMQALRPGAGGATVIGFTGPPGAGKSTLVNGLIRAWRQVGQRVAVLAVDPVSPLSGGAVLGDRTRMGAHSADPGVFIRSLSARGHLGGLSAATLDMVDVMDAAGWDLILLETVGAGQSETEIAAFADVTVVICAPGLGDDVQAIKAGILEVADILVVNKADRPDADRTARELKAAVGLRSLDRARTVSVLRTSGISNEGISELHAQIEAIAAQTSDRKPRRLSAFRAALADRAAERLRTSVMAHSGIDRMLEDVAAGRIGMDQALIEAIGLAYSQHQPKGDA